ncbi:hypothetical protein [Litchfieldia alkalitelluris]|nr:hypothetical protein [Litchfieldia alkalitelluris]
MEQEEFPVAHLSPAELEFVKQTEERLRSKTGEEIVLIAYKHEDERNDN